MKNCLIFNHHSLPFDTRDAADRAMPEFLKICIEAKNAGLTTILADQTVDPSWFRVELAHGYYWQNWHEQQAGAGDRDAIRAFRSIATQSPFFNMQDAGDGVDLFEVSLCGRKDYIAVCAAVWHEAPMASFETREPWSDSPLKVQVSRLNVETEEFECENVQIQNFYSYAVFHRHLPELLDRRDASVASGKEIGKRLEELYPGVLLCGKAPQQLNNWSASLTILEQVKHSLLILSQFTVKWQRGEISEYRAETLRDCGLRFEVSRESTTVRNTPKLRSEREFWLPTGSQEYFEQHIKLSSGYRIHFYPDSETHQIYIGYIGPHLRLR